MNIEQNQMKNQDKIFIVIFAIISLMLIGIIAENIRITKTDVPRKKTPTPQKNISVSQQKPVQKTDISSKVRADIEKAGLVPYEAKYWKKIEAIQ